MFEWLSDELRRGIDTYANGGPDADYAARGIVYCSEAAQDHSSYRISDHFPAVVEKVNAALAGLNDRGRTTILFHCYAGYNRSASGLLAFLFVYRWVRKRERISMHLLIRELVAVRPACLTARGGAHRNFIGCLLEFASTAKVPPDGGACVLGGVGKRKREGGEMGEG